MTLIQIYPFHFPQVSLLQHGKNQEQNRLNHSWFGKETVRHLYLLMYPEPSLGMDALFLRFSSVAVGHGISQLPLVPSRPPWQGIALSPRGTLGSRHLAGKRSVSAGMTRQEEIGRSNRKVRERGGGEGLRFFPSSILPFQQQRSHTWCECKVRPEMHNPLSLLKGCHRKVKPDEIRWGTLLQLAVSSKRHLM